MTPPHPIPATPDPKLNFRLRISGHCDWCKRLALDLTEFDGVCEQCEALGRSKGQRRRVVRFGFVRRVLFPMRRFFAAMWNGHYYGVGL
jgi:hypothetical protein